MTSCSVVARVWNSFAWHSYMISWSIFYNNCQVGLHWWHSYMISWSIFYNKHQVGLHWWHSYTWYLDLFSTISIKWGYIEQQGDIEQSYFFHGNSLISFYNSHVRSCLYFRSVTEDFWALLHFRTLLFLLMILVQNFMLIKNHIET